MNYDPISLQAAPIVAAALGRSMNVKIVVDPRLSTAKTDGKTLYLPVLPVNLEEWVATILWGLTHHESGNIRHSDMETLKEPELHSDRCLLGLLQALEDVRMERAHIRLYPGAAKIFQDLVKVLVEIDFFKPLPQDASINHAFHSYVLKYLRSTALNQKALADQAEEARVFLTNAMGEGFVTRLTAELQPILMAGSSDDALNLAFRIRQFLEEELENQQPPESNDSQTGEAQPGDASGTEGSGDPKSESQGEESKHSEQRDGDGTDSPNDSPKGPGNDDSSDAEPSHAGPTANALKEILAGSDLDSSLGDLGEALADVLEKGLQEDSSARVAMAKEHDQVAGVRDEAAISIARRVSGRLAVQLKRQLESNNDVRSDPSSRGKRISRRHLHRVAHKDYRVFSHKERLPEVNTAVVSLIDVSGSMKGRKIELASQATLATSLAFGTIPFLEHAVGAFPSVKGYDHIDVIKAFPESTEQVSSRFNLRARGQTPLPEALLWAADRLLQRSEERRIIFVATDGAPNDPESTKQILAQLYRLGIEVHGLGIQTADTHQLFSSFVEVSDVNSLPQAFLALFQRVLRRSA